MGVFIFEMRKTSPEKEDMRLLTCKKGGKSRRGKIILHFFQLNLGMFKQVNDLSKEVSNFIPQTDTNAHISGNPGPFPTKEENTITSADTDLSDFTTNTKHGTLLFFVVNQW